VNPAQTSVLLWAQRVIAKRGKPAHELLEVPATATAEKAQDAFYKIARLAHPDLHRHALTPEELEMVTQAYATVAGAYQTFREKAAAAPKGAPAPVAKEATGPVSAPNLGASRQMNARALVYYRKAESALRQGDLRAALLQIKMAIAADPASAFLRTALGEVQAEVGKK
jgi:hypothetical protein